MMEEKPLLIELIEQIINWLKELLGLKWARPEPMTHEEAWREQQKQRAEYYKPPEPTPQPTPEPVKELEPVKTDEVVRQEALRQQQEARAKYYEKQREAVIPQPTPKPEPTPVVNQKEAEVRETQRTTYNKPKTVNVRVEGRQVPYQPWEDCHNKCTEEYKKKIQQCRAILQSISKEESLRRYRQYPPPQYYECERQAQEWLRQCHENCDKQFGGS